MTTQATLIAAAQVLIRNPDAAEVAEDAPTPGTARITALVALIRAVAARTPPAGVTVEGATGTRHAGHPVLEIWRTRRFTARVLVLDPNAPADAATLGTEAGPTVAAVWVPEGPHPRHAVIVETPR